MTIWDEWTPGEDGLLFRRAARVLLFDGLGRVLLQRGHDIDDPDRHWWFTPGGGIAAGETPREGAVRELAEETGIELDPASLLGPVIFRNAVFDFAARHVRQAEVFFVAYLDTVKELDDSGWTSHERVFMEQQRWIPAVSDLTDQLYPENLPTVVAALAGGWDGTVWHLGTDK